MSCTTSVLHFPSLKKARRYGAKVRTGCRTCKIRRVKCDEHKPSCLRCTSTGRKCDGYAQDVFQTYAPKQLPDIRTMSPSIAAGEGMLYVEFYHHCASATLASHLDSAFWSRAVLQMAQTEPAIRHAVIALGYLVKTEPGDLRHARSVSVADTRKTLYQHYNKAIRCLSDSTAVSAPSVDVSLVACVLFICIEFLRGDYHAAFAHLHSGLRILAECGHAQRKSPSRITDSSLSARRVTASGIIPQTLSPIFNRAIVTGLMFGAPFEPQLAIFCPQPQLLHIPTTFSSLQEARDLACDLQNAAVILISVIRRKLYAGIQPSKEDMDHRSHILRCHDSWLHALHLFGESSKMTTEDCIVASKLKVLHYMTYVALACIIDLQQMTFDDHLSSFQALNHHAKIVLDAMESPNSSNTRSSSPASSHSMSPPPSENSKAAAHFTFEFSLIFPLFLATTYCRDPTTRRTSLSLLSRNLPREALWDAAQHALVAKRVIEIEERELDPLTGWPVQKNRLVSALISGDMDPNGGFWVMFTSAGCMMEGERRGGGGGGNWGVGWREWFVLGE